MQTIPLKELADAAVTELEELSEDFDLDEWEDFRRAPEIDRVIMRYDQVQPGNFALALHLITGWPMVEVSAAKGVLTTLCRDEEGRLVGARGVCTPLQLCRSYGVPVATYKTVSRPMHTLQSDAELRRVAAAIEWLSEFSAIHEKARRFAVSGVFFGLQPYSMRAECGHDVDLFAAMAGVSSIKVAGLVQVTDPPFPDVEVEFRSDATLGELYAVLDRMVDSHVMRETLRAVPLAENSLERGEPRDAMRP